MLSLLVAIFVVSILFLSWKPKQTSAVYPHLSPPPRASYLFLIYAAINASLFGKSFYKSLSEKYGPLVMFKIPFWKNIAILPERDYSKTFFSNRDTDFFQATRLMFFLYPKEIQDLNESTTHVIARNMTSEKYSSMVQIVKKEVDRFLEEKCGRQINLFPELMRLQGTIMTRIFVGPDLEGEDLDAFLSYVTDLDLEERILHRVGECIMPSGKKATEEVWQKLKAIIKKVVDKRIASNNTNRDFLNDVIKTNTVNGVPDYTYIAICVFFSIFAGTTNTFAASAWTLLFMEANPDVKEKITQDMKEYKKIISERKDPLPFLLSSTYTTRAITESVRLTSKGTSIRLAMEDLNAEEKFFVPKGTLLVFPYWLTSFSDKVYSDVNTYKPDRYLTEGTGSYDELSFGAGRHPCTGVKLVHMNIKTLLFTILDKYKCHFKGDVSDYLPKSQILGVQRPSKPCYVLITEAMYIINKYQ